MESKDSKDNLGVFRKSKNSSKNDRQHKAKLKKFRKAFNRLYRATEEKSSSSCMESQPNYNLNPNCDLLVKSNCREVQYLKDKKEEQNRYENIKS